MDFDLKHSTKYAALELIDRIINQMDQDEVPINIYLDLSKAFYAIDHLILIDKLKYYGINGTNLNLFSSCLNNCKQYIEINHIKSNMLPITTGIPQGSTLGPQLFMIYIYIYIISMVLHKPVKCLISSFMLMTQTYQLF